MDLKEISKFPESVQKQILEKLGKQEAENKYHSKRPKVNGITFDSNKEANRYIELLNFEKSGKIMNLKLQPEFTLIESYKDAHTGEPVRAERYRADFSYQERDSEAEMRAKFYGDDRQIWRNVVEDVKGFKTQEYINKKKQVFEKYGIRIREI